MLWRNVVAKGLKIGVLVLLCVAAMALFHRCQQERRETSLTPVLKEGEREKVIVKKGVVTVVRRDGSTKRHIGVRDAAVTIKDDGSAQIYAPSKGFTFEPGIGIYQGKEAAAGLDIQFAYWKRFGAVGGVMYQLEEKKLRPFVGIGYSLALIGASNSTALIAVDVEKEIYVGLRVAF